VEKMVESMLEPEWLGVVLAALVYSGDIELSFGAKRVNAGNLAELGAMTAQGVAGFRHYGRPPTLPVGRWADIFEALGLPPGLVRDENTREEAVRELQRAVRSGLQEVTELEHRVTQGPRLWNMPLFTDNLAIHSQDGLVIGSDAPAVLYGQTDVLPHLRAVKRLLEGLQPYDTVGKMRNLRVQPQDVSDGATGRAESARVKSLLSLIEGLQGATAYLASAAPRLPAEHPLREEMPQVREELLADLRRMGRGDAPAQPGQWPTRLAALKAQYIQAYAAEHHRLRLGPAAADRREAIYRGGALREVMELNRLEILPSQELSIWQRQVQGLRDCRDFHEGVLSDEPECPYCHLNPATEGGAGNAERTLEALEERLDGMLAAWRKAVVEALNSDTARASRQAMTPDEQHAIDAFLAHPEATVLPEGFIDAANKALRGIESVAVSIADLVRALREGGIPCLPGDLRDRFQRYIQETLRGHDEENTRVTLDEERTLQAGA